MPTGVKSIVYILNLSDFGAEASSWHCELLNMHTRHTVALWYLFNKCAHAFRPCGDIPAALKVADGDLAVDLRAFLTLYGAKTSFVLYPDKVEAAGAALEARCFLTGEVLLKTACATRMVYVRQDKRWNSHYYKEGIHPVTDAKRVLPGTIFDTVVKH